MSQDIAQRSEAWFEARLGKVTGSRFADVVAVNKGKAEAAARRNYRAELVIERLTGTATDHKQTPAMMHGTETEPLARLWYSLITKQSVEETGFWEHPVWACGVSPDGLVGDNGLVEIKCPNTATHIATLRRYEVIKAEPDWHNKGKQVVPPEYYPQVMGQLWITEREWCDFVSFDPRLPDNAKIVIVRVERDEHYINSLGEAIYDFLKEVEAECEFIKGYRG